MYTPLLFWLALAIPGYAAVVRFDRKQLNSGLLGVLALSYLASFALLSPVSILCYLLELPLAVFSVACVALVAAGVLEILRQRAWRQAGKLLAGAVSVELLIVIGDMILGARVGSIVGADAITHLARIRLLIDHGLTNTDPFVAGGYFFPLYHTNLLHALCAACAQLTGVDHFGVWFSSFVWAKLVAASGIYYLTWSVFRRQWPAWVATVFIVGTQGPITFMLYPNKLAPFWLLTMMVGLVIRAGLAPTRKTLCWVGCGALVIGQVHALYGGFAVVLLGPLIAVKAIIWADRRRKRARRLVICGLLLCVSLPFAWVSKTRPVDQGQSKRMQPQTPERGADEFIGFNENWLIKNPLRGFGGGGGWRYFWLAAGATFGLLGHRRKEVAGLLAVVVAAAVALYTPLCTVAVNFLGAKWILLRLEIVFFLVFPVLVPAAAASLCERWKPRYWLCCIASALVFAAAVPYAKHASAYNWPRYCRVATLSVNQRIGNTSKLRELRRLLQADVPAGATVLADPRLGMWLVAAYDCGLVAPETSSVGVPRIGKRRAAANAMLWGPPTEERDRWLEEYGIKFLFAPSLPLWADGRSRLLGGSSYGKLWAIDPPSPEAERRDGAPEAGEPGGSERT